MVMGFVSLIKYLLTSRRLNDRDAPKAAATTSITTKSERSRPISLQQCAVNISGTLILQLEEQICNYIIIESLDKPTKLN